MNTRRHRQQRRVGIVTTTYHQRRTGNRAANLDRGPVPRYRPVKIPVAKGSYLLILHLAENLPQLGVGRLGTFDFTAGYYLYVGSAFGSGGLPARLAYHQRRIKTHPHWHIDYLRAHTRLLEAWTVTAPQRMECNWCANLAQAPGVQIPVQKFGSRDTRCPAHLFYTPSRPHAQILSQTLLANLPFNGAGIQEILVEIHLFDEL